ncbi:MAG: FtsL-like putative cell division protein [Bacteroidetes bacterium]|nr:FtsL-like putative cell division protein [Bacteroidota bacterium]
MAENTLKETQKETPDPGEEVSEKKKASSRPARKFIRVMRVFDVFDRNQVVKAMPFILFVTLLIMFYIGNSYYAESTIRKIDRMKTELKEKRAEYISTESDVSYRRKPSEIAKAVEPMQIKEPLEPPKRIVVQAEKKK